MTLSKGEKANVVGSWKYGVLCAHEVKVDKVPKQSIGLLVPPDSLDDAKNATMEDFAAAIGLTAEVAINALLATVDNRINTGLHKRGSGSSAAQWALMEALAKETGPLAEQAKTVLANRAAAQAKAKASGKTEPDADEAIRAVVGPELWARFATV